MFKKTLLITIAIMLLASCGHMEVREPEMDPEGERPDESKLMSAPYIKPKWQCKYVPPSGDRPGAKEATAFIEGLSGSSP